MVGTTFLIAAGSRNTGSVVFDPTLPIKDVEARIGGVAMGCTAATRCACVSS
jgi:hypothetical protein